MAETTQLKTEPMEISPEAMSDTVLSETEYLSVKLEKMAAEAKKRVHDNEESSRSFDDTKRARLEVLTNPLPTYTHSLGFSKPSWLDKMPALHLDDDQKAALEKAKSFARDMQAVLLKTSGKNNTPPPIPSILLSSNPGLASGIDPRSLSVLSRIYVGSINFELTEQHLRVVFGQFGAIKSVSMSLDPITGKHKGFCFIEFETPEGASLALDSMNGAELGGRQLKVGRPNNYTAATAAGTKTGLLPPPKTRIYVSNVNEYVSEDNLLSIFESFGKIIQCILMPDLITRKHKGYGNIGRQATFFSNYPQYVQ